MTDDFSKQSTRSRIDIEIGRRLRSRREMLGLTQTELAERCGVSPQQCHKYETGASSMRAPRLIDFGAALGVPLSYFFNGLDRVDSYPDDLLEMFSDRTNSELIRLFSQISNTAFRRGLLEMARVAHKLEAEEAASHAEPMPSVAVSNGSA